MSYVRAFTVRPACVEPVRLATLTIRLPGSDSGAA